LRVRKLTDGFDDGQDRLIVRLELAFELIELLCKLLIRGKYFAQLHEGTHDVDAHLNGVRRVEDVGGLDGAMLGESVRQVFDVVAATCVQDHRL